MSNSSLPLHHIRNRDSQDVVYNVYKLVKKIQDDHENDKEAFLMDRETMQQKILLQQEQLAGFDQISKEWETMKAKIQSLELKVKDEQAANRKLRHHNMKLKMKVLELERQTSSVSKVAILAQQMNAILNPQDTDDSD